MNERIKALAEQAYREVIETDDYNGGAYTVRVFDQEKFAELIWKEAYEQGYDKGVSDSYEGQGGV